MLSETWKATLEITSRKTLSDFRELRDLARFITTFRQFQKNSLKSSKIQVKRKLQRQQFWNSTCQTSGAILNCQFVKKRKNSRKSAKRKQKRTFFFRFAAFFQFYQKAQSGIGSDHVPKKRERAKVTHPELQTKGQKRVWIALARN